MVVGYATTYRPLVIVPRIGGEVLDVDLGIKLRVYLLRQSAGSLEAP